MAVGTRQQESKYNRERLAQIRHQQAEGSKAQNGLSTQRLGKISILNRLSKFHGNEIR